MVANAQAKTKTTDKSNFFYFTLINTFIFLMKIIYQLEMDVGPFLSCLGPALFITGFG